MSMIPLRCSDISRAEYQLLLQSVIDARGDGVSILPGTPIYIECVAETRLLYNLRLTNTKMQNQMFPTTMTDFIPRWEAFLNLIPLSGDTLGDRRNRIEQKLLLINQSPTFRRVTNLLETNLPFNFVGLVVIAAEASNSFFPGGAPIVGGEPAGNGPWFSTVSQLAVEVQQPSWMSSLTFAGNTGSIFTLLNNFLPAYMTFDWINNTFTDGYGKNTITVGVNSTSVIGTGTNWAIPTNSVDNVFMIDPGTIIEAYDDLGNWQRLEVATVISNTHLTLSSPAVSNITNRNYVVQGVFLDCLSTAFPYPPTNAKNLDNGAF